MSQHDPLSFCGIVLGRDIPCNEAVGWVEESRLHELVDNFDAPSREDGGWNKGAVEFRCGGPISEADAPHLHHGSSKLSGGAREDRASFALHWDWRLSVDFQVGEGAKGSSGETFQGFHLLRWQNGRNLAEELIPRVDQGGVVPVQEKLLLSKRLKASLHLPLLSPKLSLLLHQSRGGLDEPLPCIGTLPVRQEPRLDLPGHALDQESHGHLDEAENLRLGRGDLKQLHAARLLGRQEADEVGHSREVLFRAAAGKASVDS